jgi:hypothetical protein
MSGKEREYSKEKINDLETNSRSRILEKYIDAYTNLVSVTNLELINKMRMMI